jgi:MFS family permease
MADMLFFGGAAHMRAGAKRVCTGGRTLCDGSRRGIDLPVAMAFLSEFARLKGRGMASSVAMWCLPWYAAISISPAGALFYAVLPESHSDWLWRLIWAWRGTCAGDYRHPQPLSRGAGLGGESGQPEGAAAPVV